MKKWIGVLLIFTLLLSLGACVNAGGSGNVVPDSGDPDYEAMTITIEGMEGGDAAVSVAEMRALPMHHLDASYKRTTGLYEDFQMEGVLVSDVLALAGADLSQYAGIGVQGSDGYYCLVAADVISSTPDMMLALIIDGETKLDEDNAPARLAVQGQFGPYWVKRVDKITLYTEIPEKVITSVWVFDSLAAGIEPYMYEYYGSKDASIDLEQIFSRLDHVDSKAFFTMKSSDGFKKNEAMNMVKSRYYIKTEGADAPTNISPYIKLGMNVQHISWISTNADAAVFPTELMKYMETAEIAGQEGILLGEVLYETEVETVKAAAWDVLGTEGEKLTVSGEDLFKGILVPGEEGGASVVWAEETGHKNIAELQRIRLAVGVETTGEAEAEETVELVAAGDSGAEAAASGGSAENGGAGSGPAFGSVSGPGADTVLTVTGDGVAQTIYYSMADLKAMKSAYLEESYSVLNNWPTKKFAVAKGVDIAYLLKQAGLKNEAKSFKIEAKDGYKASLTGEQLLGSQYRYPGLLEGSDAGAVAVKPQLSWAYEAGTQDMAAAIPCGLRLTLGQNGLNDVNTAAAVQDVSTITVSTGSPGNWAAPTFSASGDQVAIEHTAMDQVKIYYTLDGTEPNLKSPVYNPSTSYFQPELTQPLQVSGQVTIKAKAVGYGKYDSEVVTYAN